ncbi:putative 2OG-Fe(II) oxygenase, partial [Kordiimonas sp.]|uniref:putative 2OG-Fe(II) oxygenase n=1 Tax=Kordiimonas sp. TaxID=1970157 RepID=UPI003A8E0CEB
LTARGLSLKELGRPAVAECAYRQALECKPGHFAALHNLGGVLMQQGRAREAKEIYEQALSIGPKVPELRYAYATALYDLGDVDGADREFRTAIALKPDYIEAHDALNRLYWQGGQRALYGRSYEVALRDAPLSASLREAQVHALELAGQSAAALDATVEALRLIGATPSLKHSQARLLAGIGDTEASLEAYEEAITLAPARAAAPICLDRAKLLTRLGRYEDALSALDHVAVSAPFDQEMWAYRGLCWRLTGDSRAAWLNDYDRFIGVRQIGVPEGYNCLADFLVDLEEVLGSLHRDMQAPIDQTLRGGTQSNGALFTRPEAQVQALRGEVEKAVAAYIADLPDDPAHPFLGRKAPGFAFGGSWSVRLKEGGFHVNHVHPNGWISSSLYVSVPPSVTEGHADHQGWIKFGESGAGLGAGREVVARRIRPETGLVVLFPSYMWHGTEPFTENAPRLTTPFDIVPAR